MNSRTLWNDNWYFAKTELGVKWEDRQIWEAKMQPVDDEVGDHASVVRIHARAVGVEYPHDFDADAVLAPVIHEERLRTAFSFVVAGAYSHRVHAPPIALRLRMHVRVAVNFGGGCLQAKGRELPF